MVLWKGNGTLPLVALGVQFRSASLQVQDPEIPLQIDFVITGSYFGSRRKRSRRYRTEDRCFLSVYESREKANKTKTKKAKDKTVLENGDKKRLCKDGKNTHAFVSFTCSFFFWTHSLCFSSAIIFLFSRSSISFLFSICWFNSCGILFKQKTTLNRIT